MFVQTWFEFAGRRGDGWNVVQLGLDIEVFEAVAENQERVLKPLLDVDGVDLRGFGARVIAQARDEVADPAGGQLDRMHEETRLETLDARQNEARVLFGRRLPDHRFHQHERGFAEGREPPEERPADPGQPLLELLHSLALFGKVAGQRLQAFLPDREREVRVEPAVFHPEQAPERFLEPLAVAQERGGRVVHLVRESRHKLSQRGQLFLADQVRARVLEFINRLPQPGLFLLQRELEAHGPPVPAGSDPR